MMTDTAGVTGATEYAAPIFLDEFVYVPVNASERVESVTVTRTPEPLVNIVIGSGATPLVRLEFLGEPFISRSRVVSVHK